MESLRNKQIREVLDIWKNVGSQVFDREKSQVAMMNESVAPATQRDTVVEVDTDKGIENLQKILENKMNQLEFLLQNPLSQGLSLIHI